MMVAVAPLIGAAVSGGVLSQILQFGSGWLKSRHDHHAKTVDSNFRLEEHRDKLTFEVLTAAREELSVVRSELNNYRDAAARAAHIEEALDHIHALLHAQGVEETRAAARRARAFLKRMRPTVGDVRQEVQLRESERNIQNWTPEAP